MTGVAVILEWAEIAILQEPEKELYSKDLHNQREKKILEKDQTSLKLSAFDRL